MQRKEPGWLMFVPVSAQYSLLNTSLRGEAPALVGLASSWIAPLAIVLVPMVLMLPAILLYVGSRARAYKEAQANVSVLLFVVSLIPVVQLFMQRREPGWLMFVPVSAQYSLLNTSLRGEAPSLAQLALSWLAPAALIAIALIAVTRRLSRESILSGK